MLAESSSLIHVAKVTLPDVCFSIDKGSKIIKTDGYQSDGDNDDWQFIVEPHTVKCLPKKMMTREHIPVAEAWGGRLIHGDPIYTCVNNKTGLLMSGLSTFTWYDAQKLPCTANQGTLKQIYLKNRHKYLW